MKVAWLNKGISVIGVSALLVTGSFGSAAAAPSASVPFNLKPMSLCACTPFTDVPFDSQFATEITWLYNQKVSTGWIQPDATRIYAPFSTVNRDAMAAFMYRLAGSPSFEPPAVSPFVDVPTSSQFYKEITWLAARGITTGWVQPDGTKMFQPVSSVNRDAMAAFMYRFAGSPAYTASGTSPFADVPPSASFYKEISWLAHAGISTGWTSSDGSRAFQPLAKVNRDAMAAFMYRLNFKIINPVGIQQSGVQTIVAGQDFHLVVGLTSGVGPYAWTIVSGSLPSGISFTNAGDRAFLDGVAKVPGVYSARLKVTDSFGLSALSDVAITVNPLEISTASLPDAAAQTSYTATLGLNGGVGPVSWKVTSGALPPGLTLQPEGYPDGHLSGWPSTMGTFSFTLTAAEDSGVQASRAYTVVIGQPPLSLMSREIQPGWVGIQYPTPDWLGSGAGFGPYTWKLTGGALPPGLTMDQEGNLAGAPQSKGSFTFELMVTDPAGQTATGTFTMSVN